MAKWYCVSQVLDMFGLYQRFGLVIEWKKMPLSTAFVVLMAQLLHSTPRDVVKTCVFVQRVKQNAVEHTDLGATKIWRTFSIKLQSREEGFEVHITLKEIQHNIEGIVFSPDYTRLIIIAFGLQKMRNTLPETNSSHLKMDGWNTFSFPLGMTYLQVVMLVSGRVHGCWTTNNRWFLTTQIIHLFIGFSIIFTIHFGVKIPQFLGWHPSWIPKNWNRCKSSKTSPMPRRQTLQHLGQLGRWLEKCWKNDVLQVNLIWENPTNGNISKRIQQILGY